MKHKTIRKILKGTLLILLACGLLVLLLNSVLCLSVKDCIHSLTDCPEDSGYDCIIVLGCGIWGDRPTPLLQDRLDTAVALYEAGVAPKLLMSGDHGRQDYDEVSVMRNYALEQGVPSQDIFMDHAGFSTYETIVRARDVFGVEKAVVVTQKYHLYRALYDASAFELEVAGIMAEGHSFSIGNRVMWEARETLARVKDFFWCIFKPEPTYRGEMIDIHGNGKVTLD